MPAACSSSTEPPWQSPSSSSPARMAWDAASDAAEKEEPSTALARPASTAALTTSWTPRCLGVKVPLQGQVRVMSEA